MPRVRRTLYVFFHYQGEAVPDIEQLLRGVAALTCRPRFHAISILTGEEHPISQEEFELASSVASDHWTGADAFDPETLRALARKGVLISDEDDDELAELRLRTSGWPRAVGTSTPRSTTS